MGIDVNPDCSNWKSLPPITIQLGTTNFTLDPEFYVVRFDDGNGEQCNLGIQGIEYEVNTSFSSENDSLSFFVKNCVDRFHFFVWLLQWIAVLDFGWYVHSCILCRVWPRTKQNWICACLCEATTSTFDSKRFLNFLSKIKFVARIQSCELVNRNSANKSKGVIFWRASFSFLEATNRHKHTKED